MTNITIFNVLFLHFLLLSQLYQNLSGETTVHTWNPHNSILIEGHIFKCSSVATGYRCTLKGDILQQNLCRTHTDVCPSQWGCFDLHDGFLCKPHRTIGFGEHFRLWFNNFPREKRALQSDKCGGKDCQLKSICQNGICRCLRHYTGQYCDEEINYCENNPCINQIRCIPRIGGITCDCPPYRAGKFCQAVVAKADFNMKQPNFLHESFQYAGFSYYYIFHVIDLGFQAVIKVDFGDGTVSKQQYSWFHVKDAFDTFDQFFRSPFTTQSNKLEVYKFKHTYSKPNIYTVNVRAWNSIYEVFNTSYEVHVRAAPNCTLEVALRNAEVNDRMEPLYLYREDAISILSATQSNCLQMEFKYQWQIHKVDSFQDNLSPETVYRLNQTVDLQSPNLEVSSFTLDFGSYAAMLCVEMIRPKPGIKREVLTWFFIKRKPNVAHIEGGGKILVHTRAMFYLDASMSYDPNFPKNKQPPLTFTWTCHPKNKFCKGYYVLDERSSVLVVPANSLTEQKYTFTVWVNSGNSTEVDKFTGRTTIKVYGVSTVTSFYEIRCLRNCIGGHANPSETIALRGICVVNPKSTPDLKKSWIVYPNPDTNMDRGMRLDNSEISSDNNDIVLYEQQLEPGQDYKFVFSGYNRDTGNDAFFNENFAEFRLKTYDPPEAGNCSVTPVEGYSMLTVFSLFCSNFLPGGPALNETLKYEVIQYNDIQDRASSGAMVGYDLTGNIRNITLSPGFFINDYVTTLRITAANNNGLLTFVECNVTVFPLSYFLQEPMEVLRRFNHIGAGSLSPLSLLLASGNYFELVQQIISTSFALEQFLNSEDSDEDNINPEFLQRSLETIYDNFMSYLNKVPLSGVKALKHIATALDRVMILLPKYTTWRPGIVIGINILQKLIAKLKEKENVYNEMIVKDDLDDIGVILVNIAANILKTPTADPEVLREDIIDPINTLVRLKYTKRLDPYDISSETLAKYDSDDAEDIMSQFMQIYISHKLPNERTSLISASGLSILMRKAAPEFLTMKSLSVAGRVSVKLLFDQSLFDKNAFCNLEMIVMDNDPNWYDYNEPSAFLFPFVKINLTNEVDGSPVDADLEVDLKPIRANPINIYNGSLPIVLFSQIEERHIQVYRIIVEKGGKLLVEFLPIENNHKVEVVIKKNSRPKMSDFWYNAITIPQKVLRHSGDKGLSIFVDDEVKNINVFYYLGLLPNADTLKVLMKDVEQPILSHAFQDDDEPNQEYNDGETNSNEKVRKARQLQNDTTKYIRTLPYSFTAHGVYCVTWDEVSKHWAPTCNVKPNTMSSRVTCNCSDHAPVTATFHKVSVKRKRIPAFDVVLISIDNPLIIFLVVFTFIFFLGLFAWGADEDRKDNLRQTVCFLIDNYPHCEYSYLVIVHTGRLIKAGTTSNVTIELEGTNATSLAHVLKDWRHEVMGCGQQDWFVLKTTKPLGEIYCLHIWSDYSGARPSWYCSKILVHDIQEQQVWFFNVEKWFDPIHGDGSMSYTIYQSTDTTIFSSAQHLKEDITREFDSGMHGWFSIFFKHPYNNYTRKQRIAVAHLHLTVMMVLLVLLNDIPLPDSPRHQMFKTGSYEWEANDLVKAIYAVVIAFPIHNLCVWFFRCIKPSAGWTESIFEHDLSRFNFQDDDYTWLTSEPRNVVSAIKPKDRELRKTVSFSQDFYEPERGQKQTLRSKFSMEKLENKAGKDKVVPLRLPTSKVETEASTDVFTTDDLNTPIYGREIVTQSYCFPPCCVYILWIILLLAEVPCNYFIVLTGISYGWIFSLHYLTSLFFAVFISMFIVEPVKLCCWSLYLFVYNKREFAVEDRSDLVETLNPQFIIPPLLETQIVLKINILRDSDMYSPLAEQQLRKLKRNRVVNFITRMILADAMLLVLFVLLLSTMIFNVFDELSYLQHRGVKRLLTRSQMYKDDAMARVQTQEDLVNYLNNTLVDNLYANDEDGFASTSDGANHVVGVVQLRQVRRSPYACKPRTKRWAARCVPIYDNINYTAGWKKLKIFPCTPYSIKNALNSWFYVKKSFRLGTFFVHYNQSAYPEGGYMVNLGSTKSESVMDLQYLAGHKWFDHLTAVVFIDFMLYNPQMHFLSLVKLMAERTEQGLYYIYDDIQIIKMNPVGTHAQLIILILFCILFIWLIIFVNKESHKYSLIRPKQFFTKKWDRLKKFLLFLGLTNMTIYIYLALSMDNYHEIIARASNDNFYPDFENAKFFNMTIKIMIAFMLFLIILDLCHLFHAIYRIKRVATANSKALEWAKSYYVFAIVLALAFTWPGIALFSRGSYNFANPKVAFCAIIDVFSRHFAAGELGDVSQIPYITFIYCFTSAVIVVFVFRWLVATIVIHSYSAVKRNARPDAERPVLSHYTKKYFDTIDATPNRKPVKLILYMRKIEPRMRALGFLFVDMLDNAREKKIITDQKKPRAMAMDAIALTVLRKRHKFEKEIQSTLNADHFRRKEQAKALARSIIFINTLKTKFDYLDAKIDVKIREARLQKLYRKTL